MLGIQTDDKFRNINGLSMQLGRLRAENERLRAEIAVVKKRIALREERFAAQLKAKKLNSSKNCVTKGIS